MEGDLLVAHVEHFNEGVRSGDFSAMLAGLAADGEMVFEGVRAGPFDRVDDQQPRRAVTSVARAVRRRERYSTATG
jgi:hypothetical protein